jgi:hypothetical protein
MRSQYPVHSERSNPSERAAATVRETPRRVPSSVGFLKRFLKVAARSSTNVAARSKASADVKTIEMAAQSVTFERSPFTWWRA